MVEGCCDAVRGWTCCVVRVAVVQLVAARLVLAIKDAFTCAKPVVRAPYSSLNVYG